jgi:hypothetical protein
VTEPSRGTISSEKPDCERAVDLIRQLDEEIRARYPDIEQQSMRTNSDDS